MKKFIILIVTIVGVLGLLWYFYRPNVGEGVVREYKDGYCLTGAFIANMPTRDDIAGFKKDYGKKPYLVLVFVDWQKYPDSGMLNAISDEGCCPVITWEPWQAVSKEAIGYDKLLQGGYDEYIMTFAKHIRSFNQDVFIRFAHEMNGNWYPWSGSKIGVDKYKAIYKHVKDIFDKEDVKNVKWVFSINWEDAPNIEANGFLNYYPGDMYVDYVGIDGYNWGKTRSWSRWISFKELFEDTYKYATKELKKPVLITEFSSTSTGGDKAGWIRNAMHNIKNWKNVKGFMLFNVNKEVDWSFPINDISGKELREQLKAPYFKDGFKYDE